MERQDSTLEVMNFGVPGFGLDQAYLRYQKMIREFELPTVLLGFMPENMTRHVNTYRPFYYPGTDLPLGKPRFKLDEGQLKLVPNPFRSVADYERLLREPQTVLSEVGRYDFYYRFSNRIGYTSSAWDRSPTIRLFKLFIFQVKRTASTVDLRVEWTLQ